MRLLKKFTHTFGKVVEVLTNPRRLYRYYLKCTNSGTLQARIDYDVYQRPNYAYGVYNAALQAKALGINHISVIEFGVAGGNGLVALESLSAVIGKELDIRIDVYGFDMGEGLPAPSDYRDLPYVWQKGNFKMDVETLRSRLCHAKLIIGDVAETLREFIANEISKPIGFISFDMDYYSSTINAFQLLKANTAMFIPRVYCYFDDCIGDERELHTIYSGELLAIAELNLWSEKRKLARINGLSWKRMIPSVWNDEMYVYHLFEHRLYGRNINPQKNWQLPLTN
jgi:hypothetical protein